jgi:flavin-binding protein dodecin
VKLPRFRSESYEKYLRVIESVESSASSATKAAQEARASAEEVLLRLREIEEDEQRGATGRVIRLTVLCAVVLLLAAFFTYNGLKGFANPLAVPSGSDSIEFAVQVPQPSQRALQQPAPATEFIVYASFNQDDDNFAEYQVFAPSQDAGKKYVLMLQGSARVDHPTGMIPEPGFRSTLSDCDYVLNEIEPATGPCELIKGTFPDMANAEMPADAANCDEGSSDEIGNSSDRAVEIDLGGTSHILTSSDWAYQTYTLPSFTGLAADAYLNRWNGVDLEGWYKTGALVSCRLDITPTNGELTDASTPATVSTLGALLWNSNDSQSVADALVFRQRDAEEIGNGLVALGASTAALAIGFIPIAYDAIRVRKRVLKRQAVRDRNGDASH